MSKFNKGDKVKVIKTDQFTEALGFKNGDISEINQVHDFGNDYVVYGLLADNERYFATDDVVMFYDYQLELIADEQY